MPNSIAAKAWIAATILVVTASASPLRVPAAQPQVHEAWPDPDWRVATPAEQGLDGRILAELVEFIARGVRYPDLHSLLIVRNGYLVVEEYFHGHDAAELHTLQSDGPLPRIEVVDGTHVGEEVENALVDTCDDAPVDGDSPPLQPTINGMREKATSRTQRVGTRETLAQSSWIASGTPVRPRWKSVDQQDATSRSFIRWRPTASVSVSRWSE